MDDNTTIDKDNTGSRETTATDEMEDNSKKSEGAEQQPNTDRDREMATDTEMDTGAKRLLKQAGASYKKVSLWKQKIFEVIHERNEDETETVIELERYVQATSLSLNKTNTVIGISMCIDVCHFVILYGKQIDQKIPV